LQISAPFLVFGLVFNVGLGVLSRMMPQLAGVLSGDAGDDPDRHGDPHFRAVADDGLVPSPMSRVVYGVILFSGLR